MSNASLVNTAVNRLISQSNAVGRLAQDNGGFAAVVAAFESRDANAFRWVLERLEMLPYCEIICEWVRVKLCSLRTAELCSPLIRGEAEVPNLREFARAIAKLTSNEKVLRRVADAVACGDAAHYQAALNELQLGEFCSLISYWVCSVSYLEFCHSICDLTPVTVHDPLLALRLAGEFVAKAAKNEKALDAMGKAVAASDFDNLQSTVATLGFGNDDDCRYFCLFICVWWRVWTCHEFCEVPPRIFTGPDAIDEAQSFALAAHQLAGQPRAMTDLVDSALSRNTGTYREIVRRFRLEPYCWQLCGWVSSSICYGFCIRICPPNQVVPLFTTVGNFNIYTQIDPGSGLTGTSLPPTVSMPWGGGPNYAFYNELQLGGVCPVFSPTSPGTAMQFRLLYASSTTTLPGAINAAQTSITVAAGAATPATPFNVAVCNCSLNGETGETMTVTAVVGSTWTVTRGADGTTAAAASAGTTLLIGLTPITGPLVDTPLQIGQRYISSWPQDLLGIAGPPSLSPTIESVYVGNLSDPAAPTLGSPYIPPAHYLEPDPTTGWVQFDSALISSAISVFLNFDTTKVVIGGCSLTTPPCIDAPGGAPAGSPASNPGAGSDLAIIFQATRQGITTVDYSNSLCKIHINNWSEVNNLWFTQFSTGCCTPIDQELSVQFTVDHEQMAAGGWSLGIGACALPLGLNLTPTASTPGPPPVTVSSRGGYGTIDEDTSLWPNCSYTVGLSTRPGLTTGTYDRPGNPNTLTFAICDHVGTTLTAPISATSSSMSVSSSAGFPATPFNAFLPSTGEIITVNAVSGTTWTVVRGQAGTTAAAAATGATVSAA
jgi:hypothetical protein